MTDCRHCCRDTELFLCRLCTKELGDPFRKDALSRPVRFLDKYQGFR